MDNSLTAVVFEQILLGARQRGLNQAALAQRCGVSVENLSRIKKRGNVQLATLTRLAEAAGGTVQFVATDPAPLPGSTSIKPGRTLAPSASTAPQSFRERYANLIWSNSQANDDVLLRAALLRPQFHILLDAALEFGLPRLQTLWASLLGTEPEARHVHIMTTRILRNIQHGYEQAQA